MIDKPLTLEQNVDSLARWAFADSRVELDRELLKQRLQADLRTSGRLMTEEECELFVCGDDEGEVPQELERLFPRTQGFVASHW